MEVSRRNQYSFLIFFFFFLIFIISFVSNAFAYLYSYKSDVIRIYVLVLIKYIDYSFLYKSYIVVPILFSSSKNAFIKDNAY